MDAEKKGGASCVYTDVKIYLYLASRGYELSVGRIGKLEYRPFGHIRDGYPRYLFTLDPLLQERDGIRHLNMASFMQDGGDLI